MGSNKGETFRPDPLTPDEVMRLLRSCPPSWTGIRAKAVIATLWRTGMRRRELVGLRLSNYRREGAGRAAALRIMQPKGLRAGKEARIVPVDAGLEVVLEEWLEIRSKGAHLFNTRAGGPIETSRVYKIVRAARDRAGLEERRIHPHGLRHTCAADLVCEGVSMHHIQRLLGHTNLSVTAKYLAGIGHEETVSTLAKRVW